MASSQVIGVAQLRSPEMANTSRPNASSLSNSPESVSAAAVRCASYIAMQDCNPWCNAACTTRKCRFSLFGDSTSLRCMGHGQIHDAYPSTIAKSIRPEIADCCMACICSTGNQPVAQHSIQRLRAGPASYQASRIITITDCSGPSAQRPAHQTETQAYLSRSPSRLLPAGRKLMRF